MDDSQDPTVLLKRKIQLLKMQKDAENKENEEKELQELEKREDELGLPHTARLQNMIEHELAESNLFTEPPDGRFKISPNSIFVGKLSQRVKKETLEAHFQGCGAIKRTTIVCDRYSHLPKGYAYMEFVDPQAVDKAMKLSETLLEDQLIEVRVKRDYGEKWSFRRGTSRRRFRRY